MNKITYRNFTLIDGNGGQPIKNASITVEGERIVAVNKEVPGAELVDLDGKYLMPGIINSHVHITVDPVADPFANAHLERPSKPAIRGVRNAMLHLKSGTTYFRDLGAAQGIDLDLRDSIKEGIIEGAEFKTAGRVITMTGGHGWQIGREADGCDETRKAAREQLKAGVDVIKIMATGGVMTEGVEPGSAQLSMEEMKVAVEEAHKAGKKTASHAQGTQGIKNAIEAGIDSIEHGIILDEEAIQMMKDKGTYLVPTLAAPYFIVENGLAAGIRADVVKKAADMIEVHVKSFKMAYEAGVKIAMGTDSGTPFNMHHKAWYELKLMIDAGMTPMDAIVSSTRNSAELLDIIENYGTIEEGKFADFLVLDKDPLEDIETLENINSVYKKGKLVK